MDLIKHADEIFKVSPPRKVVRGLGSPSALLKGQTPLTHDSKILSIREIFCPRGGGIVAPRVPWQESAIGFRAHETLQRSLTPSIFDIVIP